MSGWGEGESGGGEERSEIKERENEKKREEVREREKRKKSRGRVIEKKEKKGGNRRERRKEVSGLERGEGRGKKGGKVEITEDNYVKYTIDKVNCFHIIMLVGLLNPQRIMRKYNIL